MQVPIWLTASACIIAYLMGSLSPSVWIARHFGGIELRSIGSGNPGSTNVLRSLGWLPGVATFLCDLAKGFLVPFLCVTFLSRQSAYWAAGAVLIGHAFPIFLQWKGGKCVATGLGVMLALFPAGGWILCAVMLVMAIVTRVISLTSMTCFTLYAVVLLLFPVLSPDVILPFFALGAAAFIVWRHRENIQRLLRGEEKRLHVPRKKK